MKVFFRVLDDPDMSVSGLHAHGPKGCSQNQVPCPSFITLYVSGADGHACLLRAVCEVGSAPEHEDGILGDFVGVLLNTKHSDDKAYTDAQLEGQVSIKIVFDAFIH